MLPSLEIVVRAKDHDLAPPVFEIDKPTRIDRRPLRFPKCGSVSKIALVAEQVGNDLAGIGGKVEQGDTRRDRLTDEKPRRSRTADFPLNQECC
jgi:hypothetical protein